MKMSTLEAISDKAKMLLLNYPSSGWPLRASEMDCSVKKSDVASESSYIHNMFRIMISKLYTLTAVVIWHFLLGGVQWWEDPLLWCGCHESSMLKILEKGTRLEKPENIACAPE